MYLNKILVFSSLILSFSLFSCTLGGKKTFSTKNTTAPKMYKYGRKLMKSGDYENALRIFKKLRKIFPMSLKYTTLAELRIADTYRLNEHFGTAASAYRDFMKNHPLNPYVISGYTTYMIGYCNYRLGPGDFFLFPPAYEKDLSNTRSAYIVFKIFLRKYPDSKYIKKAKRYYKKSLELLASHEWYTANFYRKKKKYKAVKMRLEFLLVNYPDSKLAPKASLQLVSLYLKDGEVLKAKKLLTAVKRKFSGSTAEKAERMLAELNKQEKQ